MRRLLAILVGFVVGAGAWAQEPTPEYSNTLRWKTASEVDNFGFDVYRGDVEDGPFVRLNEAPIPGAGTIDEPQSYVYVDSTIDPRRAYWYYVESISLSGTRERFTPVFRAAPKIAEADDEPEQDAGGESGSDADSTPSQD